MKKIKPAPRKRPLVTGTLVGVRLQPDLLAKLDAWVRRHGVTSRPEAVRQILKDAIGKHKS